MNIPIRSGRSMRVRERRVLCVVALAGLLFVAGVGAAPLLDAAGRSGGWWVRVAYAPLCHQIPERALEIAGRPMAVCARCAGLYAGGIAGLAAGAVLGLGLRRRLHPAWLVLAALPTLIDFLLPWIGMTGAANLPRHLLAWPAGLAAGLLLARGVYEMSSREPRRVPGELGSGDGTEVLHG